MTQARPRRQRNEQHPHAEHGGPTLQGMLRQCFLHDPDVLVEVINFNVQVSRLDDRFPKKEQEKQNDEEEQRTLHHLREFETDGKGWVVSVKHDLGCHHAVPHDEQRDGVNPHHREEHPCLVGKPPPTNHGNEHLEELETVDGHNPFKAGQFRISAAPKRNGHRAEDQGKKSKQHGDVVGAFPFMPKEFVVELPFSHEGVETVRHRDVGSKRTGQRDVRHSERKRGRTNVALGGVHSIPKLPREGRGFTGGHLRFNLAGLCHVLRLEVAPLSPFASLPSRGPFGG